MALELYLNFKSFRPATVPTDTTVHFRTFIATFTPRPSPRLSNFLMWPHQTYFASAFRLEPRPRSLTPISKSAHLLISGHMSRPHPGQQMLFMNLYECYSVWRYAASRFLKCTLHNIMLEGVHLFLILHNIHSNLRPENEKIEYID